MHNQETLTSGEHLQSGDTYKQGTQQAGDTNKPGTLTSRGH